MESIGKTKQKIVLADTVQLKAMNTVSPDVVKPILDKLKGGILANKLYDMIFSQEKSKKG